MILNLDIGNNFWWAVLVVAICWLVDKWWMYRAGRRG